MVLTITARPSDAACDEGNQSFGVTFAPFKFSGVNQHPPRIVHSRQNDGQGAGNAPLGG